MARTINEQVIKKVFAPHRVTQSLVSTPGLKTIGERLLVELDDFGISLHDEMKILRALELAWLEGASIIAATTNETVMLEHRLPR